MPCSHRTDNLAAKKLHLLVEHGLAELYPHWIIFSTSVGAGETSGGKGTGRRMLDVWSLLVGLVLKESYLTVVGIQLW